MSLRYEVALHGRQDDHMIEELLQEPLKIKRDIHSGYKPLFDSFSDFGYCFLGFLSFPFRPIRLFAVPGSGEEFILVKSVFGVAQSLSAQRVREGLARLSENKRKKRILQGARLVVGVYGHQTRSHNLRHMSIVFEKNIKNFSSGVWRMK